MIETFSLVRIEPLGRLTLRSLAELIQREEFQPRALACYDCEAIDRPLVLENGRALCLPCRILSRSRAR